MVKRFVLEVAHTTKGLSVKWSKNNMNYFEMLGYLEHARDIIKKRSGKKK